MTEINLDQSENKSEEQNPEKFGVSPELMDEIIHALELKDSEQLDYLLASLHSADLADIFEQLNSANRKALAGHMGSDMDPEVLSELDDITLYHVIGEMEDRHVVEAITQMESDDAVHVLEDMDAEDQRKIIDALPDEDRLAVEEGLSFPEDSAGRLLQRNLITVPGSWSVEQVVNFLRADEELPTEFYEVFVVDPLHHPIGTLSLSALLRAGENAKVMDIMDHEPKVVPVNMDQEEVAHIFRQYDLTSVAVVDEDGRLLGMITVDDVVDVIDEEAEEDILRMAGVTDTGIAEGILEASKNRIIWLLVNLATAVLASMVIALFDASIEQMVALAILMPIVASMGGNAGTQTMTVAVRALATRDLTSSNAMRVVGKEFSIATLNGFVLALIIGVLAGWYFNNVALGLVLALAMTVNMIMAGLAGILVPLGLDRMKLDPALSSSIFVTTITDVVGFFAFLGLAVLVLL